MQKTNKIFYAIFEKKVEVTFDKGVANSISYTNKTCSRYNNEESCSILAPTYVVASNYRKVGLIRVSGNAIPDQVLESGTINVIDNAKYKINTIEIMPVPRTSTSCNSTIYNGSQQEIASTNKYILLNNKQTNVGTYTVTARLTGNNVWSDNTTTDKTFNCTISKRTITYKADSATKVYDGTPLTAPTASVTAGSLPTIHKAIFNITGTLTNVGTTTNRLNSVVIKDKSNNDVTSNYTITTANGTLTVTKKVAEIPTVSLCVARTYNGSYQNLTSVTGGIGYTLSGYNQTNAGTYTITGTLNGNYRWSDGTRTAKTFTCVLSKRDVTYKADSATKAYDGTALTVTTATLISGSLASGQIATPTTSGSIINVGSATNTLSSVTIRSGSTTVTSNYNITKQNGTLTVTNAIVAIPTNSLCVSTTYTGTAQTLTTVTSTTAYKLSGYSQTNAGTHTITATLKSNYQWRDGTTSAKTFNCTMNKKAVTYTIGSSSKVYDGVALTNKTCTVTSGSIVSGHSKTCSSTSTITNAGSITNTLDSVIIKNSSIDVTSNYEITKVNGTLTINKRPVTYTAGTSTRVYNGSPLTNTTAKLTSGTLVSGQTATITNIGSITNVGSITNTLSSVVIKSGTTDVSGNYTITKINGTLTITNATFTSSSVTIIGTPLVGNTLTSNPTSSPTASSYTYQWWTSTTGSTSNAINISGATNKTYKLTANESGKYVGVTVTSNLANYTSKMATKVSALINNFTCSIAGTPTSYVTSATLTGTITSGVTGYAWSTSATTPSSWTSSTATTQKTTITSNGTWYLHIKSDEENTKYCSTSVTKIDRTGPTISSLFVTGKATSQTIHVNVTASDTQSGIAAYYYNVRFQIPSGNDGMAQPIYVESSNPNYTWTGKTPGTYIVYVYAEDTLGNVSSTASEIVVVS